MKTPYRRYAERHRAEVALDVVTEYVRAVTEHVEARLAGGERADVAYPEAMRHELEHLRRATE